MIEEEVRQKYRKITKALIEKKLIITTMESCTSGQIASLITDTEGSSAVMKGAFVTYSNEAKMLFGVSDDIINKYGVYSVETAVAMAKAAKGAYMADISVGVTGTMGNPDPANSDSRVGEAFFAIAYKEEIFTKKINIPCAKDRHEGKLYVANEVAVELDRIIEQY